VYVCSDCIRVHVCICSVVGMCSVHLCLIICKGVDIFVCVCLCLSVNKFRFVSECVRLYMC